MNQAGKMSHLTGFNGIGSREESDSWALLWWKSLRGKRSSMTQSGTCNCITFTEWNNERHYCKTPRRIRVRVTPGPYYPLWKINNLLIAPVTPSYHYLILSEGLFLLLISFLFTKAQTTRGTKRCICNMPWDEKDTNQQRQKWEHWQLELARCYFECGTSGANKWQKKRRREKKHFSKVAKVNIIQFIPLKGKLRVVNAILHVSDLGSLVYHLKF